MTKVFQMLEVYKKMLFLRPINLHLVKATFSRMHVSNFLEKERTFLRGISKKKMTLQTTQLRLCRKSTMPRLMFVFYVCITLQRVKHFHWMVKMKLLRYEVLIIEKVLLTGTLWKLGYLMITPLENATEES